MKCSVEGCERGVHCKGMCQKHYYQKWQKENPEKHAAHIRAYRQRNIEKHRAYDAELKRKYRRENPEKFAEIDRKRRLANRDKYRIQAAERARRRRADKANAEINDFTESEWQEMLRAHDYECFYCPSKDDLTQDHLTPLSRGGDHSFENIVPACRRCNSRKGTMTLEEFLERIA